MERSVSTPTARAPQSRFDPMTDFPGDGAVEWRLPTRARLVPAFLYTAERERGLDDTEDLASPGEFSWPLSRPGEQAVWVLEAGVARENRHSRRES